MDRDQVGALKKRYAFDEWRLRRAPGESIFIWKHVLGEKQLPGWRPERIQAVRTSKAPPGHTSLWQRTDGRGRALLNLDIFECGSAIAAHEYIVWLLAEFQSPLVDRRDELAIGSVSFTVPDDTAILFARSNLVVMMRNAGPELVPLAEIARRFDASIAARPTRTGAGQPPRIDRFDVTVDRTGRRPVAALALEASHPRGRPVWFKLFAADGNFGIRDHAVAWVPAGPGRQEIAAYALGADLDAVSATLRFDAGGAAPSAASPVG
jgi:hypothetical protein